jgi:hypothetical protein
LSAVSSTVYPPAFGYLITRFLPLAEPYVIVVLRASLAPCAPTSLPPAIARLIRFCQASRYRDGIVTIGRFSFELPVSIIVNKFISCANVLFEERSPSSIQNQVSR